MVPTKNVKLLSKPVLVSISNGKKIKIKPNFNFDPKEYLIKN
tara:strand:+ start:488 stop:613 length:126 start_codon:yes stop_codon:yes gene_type:complete